jgi:hypothetical protein
MQIAVRLDTFKLAGIRKRADAAHRWSPSSMRKARRLGEDAWLASHTMVRRENSDRMPSAARLMKFCQFVRDAFARAALTRRPTFVCRHRSFGDQTANALIRRCKPCHEMRLAARSQLKRKQGFVAPYAPPVLTSGRLNRSEKMIGTRMHLSESLRSARSGTVPTDAV